MVINHSLGSEVKMKKNNNNIITLEYVEELDKTTKFVSLTVDAMFKSIMKRNKKILKDFIVEAFGFDDVKNTDEIEFLSNDLEKSNINEKCKLIDLNLRLGEKYIIDIEMNKTLYAYVRERNDMYYRRFVTLQVKVGDNYKNVEQLVIFQLILNASEKEKMDAMVERAIEREALKQGKEENKIEMIKSMLENNADYEFISKVSNKTIEKIKEIEKSMK